MSLKIRNWFGIIETEPENGHINVTVTLAADPENPFEGRGFDDEAEAVEFGRRKLWRLRSEGNGHSTGH